MDEAERLRQAAELAAATGITPFGEMGANLHELFLNMQKAGFDRRQSLYLVGCAMSGNPGFAPPVGGA